MLLELFPFVIFKNAMAFVYAYFFSDFSRFYMSLSLLIVTLRGVSTCNKHCLLPFFHCTCFLTKLNSVCPVSAVDSPSSLAFGSLLV